MKEFNHYIFDFDLTLFDTLKGFEICYDHAFSKVGVECQRKEVNLFAKEDLRTTFYRVLPESDEKTFRIFEKEFLKQSAEVMAKNAQIYDDTLETLDLLKRLNKRLSIVSGKPKDRIIEILDRFSAKDYFDVIIGYGEYDKEKPAPDSINKCIEFSDVPRSQTVYIGDSQNDIEAAENAKITPILICRNMINYTVSGNHNYQIITSLYEIIRTIHLSLFSVCSLKLDVYACASYEDIISKWCERNQFSIAELNEIRCEISIDSNITMDINKHGIVVFNELINVSNKSPGQILVFKDQISKSRINDTDERICYLLHSFEKHISDYYNKKKKRIKLLSKWETKVHYTLSSYLFSTIKNDQFFENNSFVTDEVIWLLTKKPPHIFCDISLNKVLEKSEAKKLVIDSNNHLLALWGARVFLVSESNTDLFREYVSEEKSVQNLWLLFSQTNKWIDSAHNKKISVKELIDSSFEIMLYEARYKYIASLRTHRYRIDISNMLYSVSNLNTIENFFKEKSFLFERKMQIESTEREGNNDSKVNITLFILTIVSTVSAIFQVINYWFDSPSNNIASIATTIAIILVVIASLLTRFLYNKFRKHH